jgi:hypothetical protein
VSREVVVLVDNDNDVDEVRLYTVFGCRRWVTFTPFQSYTQHTTHRSTFPGPDHR